MRSTPFGDADERLDVREVDGDPFGAIVAALERVSDGDTLVLTNSFEPEPLYGVLEERGFAYETVQPAPDEWHVRITTA